MQQYKGNPPEETLKTGHKLSEEGTMFVSEQPEKNSQIEEYIKYLPLQSAKPQEGEASTLECVIENGKPQNKLPEACKTEEPSSEFSQRNLYSIKGVKILSRI